MRRPGRGSRGAGAAGGGTGHAAAEEGAAAPGSRAGGYSLQAAGRPDRPRGPRGAGADSRQAAGRGGTAAPRLDIPDSITADQLDPEARAELRTLPGDLAEAVARRLAAASLEEDPERAFEYAKAARQLAARVGVVRETCGIAAYQAGEWTEALAELRTARRLTGRASYLPLMADCERALGRPDRALAIIKDPAAAHADRATQIELRIVESGIRRDQGRPEAGVVALQVPELTDGRVRSWSARLFYAYADALLDAGRAAEAREWFGDAAAADRAEETDAAERLDELDPVMIEDLAGLDEDGLDEDGLDEDGLDEDGLDEDEPGEDEPGEAGSGHASPGEAGPA